MLRVFCTCVLLTACSDTRPPAAGSEKEEIQRPAVAPKKVVPAVGPELTVTPKMLEMAALMKKEARSLKVVARGRLPTPARVLRYCEQSFDPYDDSDEELNAKLDAWGEKCIGNDTVAFHEKSGTWQYAQVQLGDGDVPEGVRILRVTGDGTASKLFEGGFDLESTRKARKAIRGKLLAMQDLVASSCGSASCDLVSLRAPLEGWLLYVESRPEEKVHKVWLLEPTGEHATLVGSVPVHTQTCDGDAWCDARETALAELKKEKGDGYTDAERAAVDEIACPVCPLPLEILSVAQHQQQVFILGTVIPRGHQAVPLEVQKHVAFLMPINVI